MSDTVYLITRKHMECYSGQDWTEYEPYKVAFDKVHAETFVNEKNKVADGILAAIRKYNKAALEINPKYYAQSYPNTFNDLIHWRNKTLAMEFLVKYAHDQDAYAELAMKYNKELHASLYGHLGPNPESQHTAEEYQYNYNVEEILVLK